MDVLGGKVQAARGDHQRERREETVVVTQDQWFGPDAAVDVGRAVEVSDSRRTCTERFEREQHARRGKRVGPGGGGTDAVLDVDEIALEHELGKRRIRVATRLAEFEQDRQDYVTGTVNRGCEFAVGIERLLGFGKHGLHRAERLFRRLGQSLERLHELGDVGQTRIDLRLGKEHRVSHDLRFCLGKSVEHPGMHIARPGPASDVGNALLIDGNYGDSIARSAPRCEKTHVIGFALEALDKFALRKQQHGDGYRRRQKPVRLPDRELRHPGCAALFHSLLGTYTFHFNMVRQFNRNSMIFFRNTVGNSRLHQVEKVKAPFMPRT